MHAHTAVVLLLQQQQQQHRVLTHYMQTARKHVSSLSQWFMCLRTQLVCCCCISNSSSTKCLCACIVETGDTSDSQS